MSDLQDFDWTVIGETEGAVETVQAFLSVILPEDKLILQTTLNGKFFFMASPAFDTHKLLGCNTGFEVHETYDYDEEWIIGWGFYDLETLEAVKMWVSNRITKEEKKRFAENLEMVFLHFMLKKYGLLGKS